MKNPMLTMIAGLVVGLLAGLGVGLVVAPEDGAPRPGVSQQTDQPIEPEAPEEPLADSDNTETAPAEESLTRQENRTLHDIIAEADIPAIPTGDAAITGTVLTADGEPVPGVTITTGSSYPDLQSTRGMTAEEVVRYDIRQAKWHEESRRTATTGDDGEYRIEGLAEEVEYSVRGEAEGWRVSPKGASWHRTTPPAECDFVATAQAKVTVKVRMPDGAVPESCRVFYRSAETTRRRNQEAEDGVATLTLTRGRWRVDAVGGEEGEYRSEDVEVVVDPGSAVEPISLTLKAVPGIAGLIEMPEGFQAPMPTVALERDPGDDLPEDVFDLRFTTGNQVKLRWEGRNLRYRFNELEDGRYRVIVMHDRSVLTHDVATLAGGVVELNLSVTAPTDGRGIGLRIFSKDGNLVQEARFQVSRIYDNNARHSSTSYPWKDEDGVFWFFPPKDLDARYRRGGELKQYLVEIAVEGSAGTSVEYMPDWTHIVDVHLQEPARTEVTLTGLDTHPARRSLGLTLTQDSAGQRARVDEWPGSNEVRENPIRLRPVEPGEYELALTVSVGGGRKATLTTRSVTLPSGDNELTVSIPDLYSLTVVPAEDGDVLKIDISANDGEFSLQSYEVVPEDGKVYFEFLPAGEYRLTSNHGEMTVRVPGRDVVTFKPRPYDCLELLIRPEGGRIEELGLKRGDKLIEIDGEAITEAGKQEVKVDASYLKESTTWIVLRDGRQVAVTFDGTDLHAILQADDPKEYLYPKPAMRD